MISKKELILKVAIAQAEKLGGFSTLKKENIAIDVGCTLTYVCKCVGTNKEFKNMIMQHAIHIKNLSIIAQGIANGNAKALALDIQLKSRALEHLLNMKV